MNTHEEKIICSDVQKSDDYPNAIPVMCSDASDQSESRHYLRNYIHILFRRRWTFFTFFLVVQTTVLFCTFLTTPIYRAAVTLKIDDGRPAVTLFDRSSSYYVLSPAEDYLQAVHEILQSRNLARRIIDALAQDKQTASSSAVHAGLARAGSDIESDIIANFLSKVTVSPVPNTRLVTVGFDSMDPAVAATTVNVIAQACTELNMGAKSNSSQTGVNANVSISNIHILDKADVPSVFYKLGAKRKMLLALFIGFFGGLGMAFFTDYLEKTVMGRDDIERTTLLPALGVVPNFPKTTDNGAPLLVNPLKENSSSLLESYRTVSAHIQFASLERPPKVMLTTSAKRSEGKTTTSINLAMILANSQGRGIIIDGDLHKPALHKVFDLDNSNGLAAFLTGPTDFDNGLIKETGVPNLDVITAGIIPIDPSQLLDSLRMRELINALVALYSFVMIDAPPVLGFSDTLALSTMVDGVIMVVRAGGTAKDSVTEAKRLLKSVNSKILGVVLNGVRESDYKHDSPLISQDARPTDRPYPQNDRIAQVRRHSARVR